MTKSKNNLESFFNPTSVAIIGASNQKGKVGNDILLNVIQTFKGDIYPINPNDETVEGIKAYKSITDVPKKVDFAVIVIPAKFVYDAVKQCGEKGCKNITIISAGFKEIGHDGAEMEKKIAELKEQYGLTVLGPNCLGSISTILPINASFSDHSPAQGTIAFLSQSGALGTAVLDMAQAQRVGMAYFVSLGNKMDIDEVGLLDYFYDDKNVGVVLAYLEDIKNGPEFISVARRVTKKKPVIILKSGKTEKGQKAVSSHTGSIAGAAQAYSAAFAQSGVIEVDEVEDFFNFAKGFSLQPLPQGNRVAVITNAGGPGILVTDLLPANGLQLADISEDIKNELKPLLPAAASVHNPVDVLGDALSDRYALAVEKVIKDKNVDAVIVILTPQKMTQVKETTAEVGRIAQKSKKPVVLCFMGEESISPNYEIFAEFSLPQFTFPLQAVKTLGAMWKYAQYKDAPVNEPKPKDLSKYKKSAAVEKILAADSITESAARDLMSGIDFPLNKMKLATNEQELAAYAKEIGYPVALKVVSPQVIHKSDVGGVKVNLKDEEELLSAMRTMQENVLKAYPDANIEGYLVGEMVKGFEVIVGMKQDPQFGPLIMAGAGGIYTEVFKDVAFGIAPLTKQDAEKMITSLKSYKMFQGVRGGKPLDMDAVVDLIVRLGDFCLAFPEIQEIDLNPVMVLEKGRGCCAVDVRLLK